MTLEQKIKAALGEQVFTILALQSQLEESQKKIAELEAAQAAKPPE